MKKSEMRYTRYTCIGVYPIHDTRYTIPAGSSDTFSDTRYTCGVRPLGWVILGLGVVWVGFIRLNLVRVGNTWVRDCVV